MGVVGIKGYDEVLHMLTFPFLVLPTKSSLILFLIERTFFIILEIQLFYFVFDSLYMCSVVYKILAGLPPTS